MVGCWEQVISFIQMNGFKRSLLAQKQPPYDNKLFSLHSIMIIIIRHGSRQLPRLPQQIWWYWPCGWLSPLRRVLHWVWLLPPPGQWHMMVMTSDNETLLQDSWEKGYFRDCNGKSNGQPLQGSVIRWNVAKLCLIKTGSVLKGWRQSKPRWALLKLQRSFSESLRLFSRYTIVHKCDYGNTITSQK